MNGEGGIRTPEYQKVLPVFETGACESQGAEIQGVTSAEFADWRTDWRTEFQKAPELAELVTAWPMLPEPIRAGILAMVRAAVTGQNR